GRSHDRIKITSSFPVNEVAPFIRLPRFHKSEIRFERAFEYIHPRVEFTRLFAFGNDGAVPGGCKETGDASAACTHAFGEGSLGNQFNFKLTGESQLFE